MSLPLLFSVTVLVLVKMGAGIQGLGRPPLELTHAGLATAPHPRDHPFQRPGVVEAHGLWRQQVWVQVQTPLLDS